MENLPQDLAGLLLLVFALGLRHGFDPDHLATVEGITRNNAGNRMAGFSGILFSAGHGCVVIAIAGTVGALTAAWHVPEWLEHMGAWISITFLVAIGLTNLLAVLRARPDQVVQTVGLKGRFLGRFSNTTNPWAVGLVGALFALSFDTVSQATLFAVTGRQFGGGMFSVGLGVLFMLGMMLTDGLHGLWVARLVRRANEITCLASRVMALAVALLSLTVALYGVLRYASPQVAELTENWALELGIAIIAIMGLSFLASTRTRQGA